ncbi:MAG: SIS domain-containing protein [Telmatospirillum sp.]|nr:SIS domain-containing protein [Telmatospirillum sp.]
MQLSVVDALRTRLRELPRQEAAVARAILADPSASLHIAIAALARNANVSQPTVLRLCRTLGYVGFPEFKVALAQSLVPSGYAYVSAHVAADDDAAAYAPKVLDAAIAALRRSRDHLDTNAVAAAVARFAASRQILVAGFGGSSATAADAVHKLGRFPIPCRALGDPILASMAVEAAHRDDLLFLLSNSGKTLAMLELAEQARARKLACVALTAPGSPLAVRVDIAILAEPTEDTAMFTPMASRIVQLGLVDVLATGLALRLGAAGQDALARVKGAVARTRA